MRYVVGLARMGAIIGFSMVAISCGKLSENLPTPSASQVSSTTAYPAVVQVILPNGNGLCTGTFISERAVLTAAHCTLTAGSYQVVASFGTFTTSTKQVLGAGVVEDPNDIALLIFPTNVASRALGQVADLATSVNSGDTLRLVGFGCNNLTTRRGAGVKRTGTNVVAAVNDYIEFLTPSSSLGYAARGILGPDNRAASCFGDSGGPALAEVNGGVLVAGVTHAGGTDGSDELSQYVNVSTRADNRAFLSTMNSSYGLGIVGL